MPQPPTRQIIDITGTRYDVPLETEAKYRQVPGESWEIGRRIDEVQVTAAGKVLALIYDYHLDPLGAPYGHRWELLSDPEIARVNEVTGTDLSHLLPAG